MKPKALYEQNRPAPSGFPFHNFPTPVTVMAHQHPVSYRHKHCPLQAQELIVMCRLRNHYQRQRLKVEMKGKAMVVMNLTPTPPALLIWSSLDENCSQS